MNLVYCARPDGSQIFDTKYSTVTQYATMPAPATVGLTIAVVFTAFLGGKFLCSCMTARATALSCYKEKLNTINFGRHDNLERFTEFCFVLFYSYWR